MLTNSFITHKDDSKKKNKKQIIYLEFGDDSKKNIERFVSEKEKIISEI